MKQISVPDEMRVDIDYSNKEIPESVKTFQPLLYKDGDSYCCVLGPDPQLGIFGCGDTPIHALEDWDKHLKEFQPKGESDEVGMYIQETLKVSNKDVW
jgi:hypothetical protein